MKRALLSVLCLCFASLAHVARAGDIEIQPYGFILVNTHFTDGLLAPGDIPVRAASEDGKSFSIFARQTRLGLKAGGPEVGGAKLEGVVEIDFWGLRSSIAAGAAGQTAPRLRLAFLRLSWKDTTLTVGQDWLAAFAPLHPVSLAHQSIPGFSSSGNLWNRVAQLRLDHNVKLSDSARSTFSLALLRPFGADAVPIPVTQDELLGAGELSGLPFVQGRAAFSGTLAGKAWTAGLAGHLGREEFAAVDLTTRALAVDLVLPLGKKASLSGEAFVGENLRMLFSSSFVVGNPAESAAAEEGKVKGGWAQLGVSVGAKSSVNLGYGIESLDKGQISQGLQKNQSVYLNWIWTLNKNFKLALEVDHIRTTSLGQADGTVAATAVDLAWQFLF